MMFRSIRSAVLTVKPMYEITYFTFITVLSIINIQPFLQFARIFVCMNTNALSTYDLLLYDLLMYAVKSFGNSRSLNTE